MKNLVEMLNEKAVSFGNKPAYIHIGYKCEEKERITFSQLNQNTKRIANYLQSKKLTKSPILILLPTGTDFISCFLGCIYANVLAVPLPIPRYTRAWNRILSILHDVDTETIITNTATIERFKKASGDLNIEYTNFNWLTLDELNKGNESCWREPDIQYDDLAFLQYTSGSTKSPKGVMVSHGNLLDNLEGIVSWFQLNRNTISVSWLPLFHDMGLIAHGLIPLITGCTSVLIDPLQFIKRPFIWLQAITKYKGTYSGAPNFAYQLCIDRISQDELDELDLTAWQSAYCGAEPVRATTMEMFYTKFSPKGFKRTSLFPGYGLAEATLLVAFKKPGEIFSTLDTSQILGSYNNKNLTIQKNLVSCGVAVGNQKFIIVNPETNTPLPDGQTGEIWISGPSVAKGYWKNPEETKSIFQAYLATEEGPYLRTGDLGIITNGELFIVGRMKDVLIINGTNYAAEDIEYSIAQSHLLLSVTGCVVFSIDTKIGEKIVAACEVPRDTDIKTKEEIILAVNNNTMEEYDLILYDLVFSTPLKLPRTTSGKLQRNICRHKYMEGVLAMNIEQVNFNCLI